MYNFFNRCFKEKKSKFVKTKDFLKHKEFVDSQLDSLGKSISESRASLEEACNKLDKI